MWSMSSRILTIFLYLAVFAIVAQSIPLRSLFVRSYEDMNQESMPQMYNEEGETPDNRSKRGLDLLKRRVEIIERNRCFFNPITCY